MQIHTVSNPGEYSAHRITDSKAQAQSSNLSSDDIFLDVLGPEKVFETRIKLKNEWLHM